MFSPLHEIRWSKQLLITVMWHDVSQSQTLQSCFVCLCLHSQVCAASYRPGLKTNSTDVTWMWGVTLSFNQSELLFRTLVVMQCVHDITLCESHFEMKPAVCSLLKTSFCNVLDWTEELTISCVSIEPLIIRVAVRSHPVYFSFGSLHFHNSYEMLNSAFKKCMLML